MNLFYPHIRNANHFYIPTNYFFSRMKTIKIFIVIISLLFAIGLGSCSKDDAPDDVYTSWLTGEYKKGGPYKLSVTENGKPLENYGSVRFDSKYLKDADMIFYNVIPGEKKREFKNVPLHEAEEGVGFTIDYAQGDKPITITGIVTLGEMAVEITM